jgi:hypothetical protein
MDLSNPCHKRAFGELIDYLLDYYFGGENAWRVTEVE